MKQQRKRLEYLRPSPPIRCMMCDKEKPAQDSRLFHGNPVCAECVVKLNSKLNAKLSGPNGPQEKQR